MRNRALSWAKSAAVTLVAGAIAFIGVVSADAEQWIEVDLPWGNSVAGVHPSTETLCIDTPTFYFDWQHSLVYSVEHFSNPAHTQFKYLDFYNGWTNPYVSGMRWTQGFLVYGGSNIPLNALNQKSFYSYDITIWLWTYLPHYAYTYTPFAKDGSNFNCASNSQVYFNP